MFSLEEIRAHEDRLMESYEGSEWFEQYDYDVAPLNEEKKRQLVKLLETTKRHVKDERKLLEYTTSSMIRPNSTFTMPMIRRIYPNLVSQGLVGIQVLPQPSGSIFFLDHHYDTDVAPTARGDRMGFDVDQGRTQNDARLYTKGYARGAILGIGATGKTSFSVPHNHTPYSDTKFTPIHANAHLRVWVDAVEQVIKFEGTPAAGEVLAIVQTGEFIFGTAPAIGATVTADYDLRMEGDDSRIPELSISMRSDTIVTERRKLKARWTLEAEQDLMAYHGISLENELTAMASREIAQEIDREIMFDLLGSAGVNVSWNSTYPGTTSGYSRTEYNETLLHALNEAESQIFRKRRVTPNWVVAGTDVAVRLQNMQGFVYNGGIQGGTIAVGPRNTGTFQGRWNIIVDPAFPANTILMGYKGNTMADAGYIYCPYVGLIATDTIMDPHDFTPRKGWMRRDGKKLVSSDFYATVTVTNV